MLIAAIIGVLAGATAQVTPDPTPGRELEILELVTAVADPSPWKREHGPHAVEVLDETWHDGARQRDVPVRVRIPKAQGRLPLIVFSHGFGGTREGYVYLSDYLASHGYVVAQPEHADGGRFREPGAEPAGEADDRPSGRLRERFRERRERPEEGAGGDGGGGDDEVERPEHAINRPADITFCIDHALKHPRLGKVIDPARIGVGGHSFGAYTAMAIAGMTVTIGGEATTFRDQRVRCAVSMSGQGPSRLGIDERSWDAVTIPTLHMTGTRDVAPAGRNPAWRHVAFEHLTNPETYFINIKGANHFTFAVTPREERPATRAVDPRHSDWIKQCVLAFFDAHVRDDAAAQAWLHAGAIGEISKGEAALERKGGAGK